jgi:hypothetical protein
MANKSRVGWEVLMRDFSLTSAPGSRMMTASSAMFTDGRENRREQRSAICLASELSFPTPSTAKAD